ncbi:hypothetical protein CQA38_01150 [Campylobacter sp. MIT 12-5580]|uniref:hypothetical protein n=1 Tax=Campylobacter sp. MIT 12-5580 TaxID=2040651 RepID=UPI0010F54346|nr:hypothetical protein [Campylobacter sp. MIT 12-5580]TKX30277.1 hypothetical protein CQA38_01150 [Campylobacter sp. MIT 12-5580]
MSGICDTLKLLAELDYADRRKPWHWAKLNRLRVLKAKLDKHFEVIKNTKDLKLKLDCIAECVCIISEFKNNNVEDFEDLFTSLEKLTQKYKNDKDFVSKLNNLIGD